MSGDGEIGDDAAGAPKVDTSGFENDALTRAIIDAIIRVHRQLGPGFLESIYRNALAIELGKQGLQFEPEKEVIVRYDAEPVGRHRLDLVVEGAVVVELKTVEDLSKAHYAQIRS